MHQEIPSALVEAIQEVEKHPRARRPFLELFYIAKSELSNNKIWLPIPFLDLELKFYQPYKPNSQDSCAIYYINQLFADRFGFGYTSKNIDLNFIRLTRTLRIGNLSEDSFITFAPSLVEINGVEYQIK